MQGFFLKKYWWKHINTISLEKINGDFGEIVCFFANSTMSKGKKGVRRIKKAQDVILSKMNTRNKLQSRCCIYSYWPKKERRRFGKQTFFNTDAYRARRHFNVLCFYIIYAKRIYDQNISLWFLKLIIQKKELGIWSKKFDFSQWIQQWHRMPPPAKRKLRLRGLCFYISAFFLKK